MLMIITDIEKEYLKSKWLKYQEAQKNRRITELGFSYVFKEYQELIDFAPSGNIYESGQTMSDGAHFLMLELTKYRMKEVFKAMKMDLTDVNVEENIETGNIGTPGRIAKMWCGGSLNDTTELLSGRWSKAPRMASFQKDETGDSSELPITIETEIKAVCSHHFIGFNNNPNDKDSKVIISYIPEKGKRGGLSKILDLLITHQGEHGYKKI